MKYLITMGLPASGKTTWAKEYRESKITYEEGWSRRKVYPVFIMDIDNKFKNGNKDLSDIIRNYWGEMSYRKIDEIIVDGLFTTNEDIIKVINNLDDVEDSIIEIHYWKENRERCLLNDKYRRNENSEISIKNIPLEKVDLDLIEKETEVKITVIYHEVSIKPQWKVFSDKCDLYLYEDSYIKSEKWSLGGSWRNCWGDTGNVSAEKPVEFTEFDDLLSKICSNISFLQYKKLYNDCVETEEYDENDYYGGNVNYAYYKCDIEKLYDKLIEIGLIES